MGEYLFIAIALVWSILFFRIILISNKADKYIKKKYPDFWHSRGTRMAGIGGGPSMFQLASELNDPIVQKYEKQWMKAIKDV